MKRNYELINEKRISLLGEGADIYCTEGMKVGEAHYREVFKCECSKNCTFKFSIIVKAKHSCADILAENLCVHQNGWKEDTTKVRLDERIKRAIERIVSGESSLKARHVYQMKEDIRNKLNFGTDHGGFFLSRLQIQNIIDTRK